MATISKSKEKALVRAFSRRALTEEDWYDIIYGLANLQREGLRPPSQMCLGVLMSLQVRRNKPVCISQSGDAFGWHLSRSRYQAVNAFLRRAGLSYRLSFDPPGRQAGLAWCKRSVKVCALS